MVCFTTVLISSLLHITLVIQWALEKEKLSVEYVNKLIQRITELEKDSSIVNREEILMLNAELDYILSVLRKQ